MFVWNTKYGVGNEGESASVCFLDVGRCLPPQTEGERWPSKLIAHKRHKEIKLREMIVPGTGETLGFGGGVN